MTVGSYPSYGWQSIWGSQKLLKHGVRWRVGDGKHIRLWGDAWLDDPGSGHIISPRLDWPMDTTVDNFIENRNKV